MLGQNAARGSTRGVDEQSIEEAIGCAYGHALEDVANGQHADYTRAPGTLVQFWGVKNGALNSSKSDFTIKALLSRRRQLLLSQGTSSAAQHRTGKHVILNTCGPKKILPVSFSSKVN